MGHTTFTQVNIVLKEESAGVMKSTYYILRTPMTIITIRVMCDPDQLILDFLRRAACTPKTLCCPQLYSGIKVNFATYTGLFRCPLFDPSESKHQKHALFPSVHWIKHVFVLVYVILTQGKTCFVLSVCICYAFKVRF